MYCLVFPDYAIYPFLFLLVLIMRYLLHQSQLNELSERQAYLYDIFQMYFLPEIPEGSYIPLVPLGTKGPNVLFITGHTHQVQDYLGTYIKQIPEDCIVITSCMGRYFKKFAAKKEVYVPNINQDYCLLRNGRSYGFKFDISDAELDFYNASGGIKERIQSAYERL